MNTELQQKLEIVFKAAMNIRSPAERARFVAESCGGEPEIRYKVEQLITAECEANNLIKSDDSSDLMIGKQIGVFELKRELGRGGMGTVFLGERVDGEFLQKAAIKLIKRGMDTDFIVKRFRHERQILALLNHPNIARLIDGGTTDSGLPYFVMEYVEGKPLYRFCDDQKLNIKERLRLFQRICEAVQAAHQIKVVHRDLKPSNILVKSDGTPKLLDFGIAKILNSDLASDTLETTATAVRLMTPQYASPEQISGEPISTASDIYSLGVLLYEILTGHRPYNFRNRAMHEIHRAVCEEMPESPSAVLIREDNLVPTSAEEKTTSSATTLAIVFYSRKTDFSNLRRELAGELDKIVLKALRKNPLERYQTAFELAEDITRFLERRPVKAESFQATRKPFVHKSEAYKTDLKGKHSAAILPFKMFGVTAGGNTDSEEFLGIGLADALVTRLSVIKKIIVRPTSSVLAFGETGDPFRAGHELAVDFVVDGNIRRIGERIRVAVQLLNVRDSLTIWTQTFDEKFTDVLELEDSISERIAHSLLPKLTGAEQKQLRKRGTNNGDAYEAYLRGRFHWNQFTPESLPKALAALEKAVKLDPNYALAYVGLADFYIWANIYGLMPSAPALIAAENAANRAIELDDQLGEAYASLGLTLQNRFQWKLAEQLYRKSLELTPNYVHAHEWYAAQLVGLGDFVRGAEESRLASRLDPLNLRTKTLTAWSLYQAGLYSEALEVARQILDLDKNYPQAYLQTAINLLATNHADEALGYFEKFDEMVPNSALAKNQLCFALVAVNQISRARAVLEEIKQIAKNDYVKPFFLGMAHAALGEIDAAFRYFEESLRENEPWMLWLGTEPMLKNLRGDERYIRLLEQMNNPLAARERLVEVEQKTDQPNIIE